MYELVELTKSGEISKKSIRKFSERFNFAEKLKASGVGSIRFIYESGISYFNDIMPCIESEPQFVNFEMAKKGIYIWTNYRRNCKVVFISFESIERIDMISYRIRIKTKKWWRKVSEIVHRGVVELKLTNNDILYFSVFTRNHNSLLKFFENRDQIDFYHTISTNPPEEDKGSTFGTLSI